MKWPCIQIECIRINIALESFPLIRQLFDLSDFGEKLQLITFAKALAFGILMININIAGKNQPESMIKHKHRFLSAFFLSFELSAFEIDGSFFISSKCIIKYNWIYLRAFTLYIYRPNQAKWVFSRKGCVSMLNKTLLSSYTHAPYNAY